MFKHRQSWKGMVVAPMKYSPNGKGIMAPIKYTPMVYSPKLKDLVLWNIVFRSVIIMVKDKKNTMKNINQN